MYPRHVGAPALRGTFGGEPTRLYRGVPSARRAFCSAKRGGATSWKHSSGSPGHHHEGHLIIYRDINLYFTHIYRGQGEREKEVEEAGENEGKREEIRPFPSLFLPARFLPLRFPFATYILPPPSFPRYALASGETHTCSYVTVMALSRYGHAQF